MQKHYDNTNGSIYKFADDHDCNSYEFDIIKRVVRCRKSGEFLEDLQKTKDLIDLYIQEQSVGGEEKPKIQDCGYSYKVRKARDYNWYVYEIYNNGDLIHGGPKDTEEEATEYAKEFIKKLTTTEEQPTSDESGYSYKVRKLHFYVYEIYENGILIFKRQRDTEAQAEEAAKEIIELLNATTHDKI